MDFIKSTIKIGIFCLILIGLFFVFEKANATTINTPPWRETFETYNAGNLSGQGIWMYNTGTGTSTYEVISSPLSNIKSGTRGLVIQESGESNGTIYASSTYDLVLNAVVYAVADLKHEGTGNFATYPSGPEFLNVQDSAENNLCYFKLAGGDNKLYARSGAGEELLASLATSTWYRIEMEYNFATEQCRARFDGGNWTPYFNMDAGYNGNAIRHTIFLLGNNTTKKLYLDNLIFSNTALGEEEPSISFEFPVDNATYPNDFSAFRVNVDSGTNTSAGARYNININYWKSDESTPIFSEGLANILIGTNNTETSWILNKTQRSQGNWETTLDLTNASGTLIDSETIDWNVISSSTITNTGVNPDTGIFTDDLPSSEYFPDVSVTASGTVVGACGIVYDCAWTDVGSVLGCNIGYGVRVATAFAFCPNSFSTEMLNDAMSEFSHVPPFDVVFEINDQVLASIASSSIDEGATSTYNNLNFSFDIKETPLITSNLSFSANPNMSDVVGDETKDAIFNLESAMIWVYAAYKAIKMLTMS